MLSYNKMKRRSKVVCDMNITFIDFQLIRVLFPFYFGFILPVSILRCENVPVFGRGAGDLVPRRTKWRARRFLGQFIEGRMRVFERFLHCDF